MPVSIPNIRVCDGVAAACRDDVLRFTGISKRLRQTGVSILATFRSAALPALVVLFAAATVHAQPALASSRGSSWLRLMLERHPEADVDKDGILTAAEFDTYRTPATYKDIPYGPDKRHRIDLYLADAGQSTPLVIFIHGGGFASGDKDRVLPPIVRRCLAAGISVASINYRYTTQQPFPGPFEDAVRAIQFLRHHAGDYRLDPDRFAAVGPSAGAGLSLYLALHDDFADPAAGDPIARQSTRLTCAVGIDAQVSYDYRFYREHGLELAMGNVRYQQMYGIDSAAAFDQPPHHAIAEACAPINFLNRGDPPLYFHYRTPDSFPPASIAHAVHHPLQGRITRAKAQPLGVPVYVHVNGEYGPGFDYIDFLVRCLTGQPLPAAGNAAPSAKEPTSKNHRMLRNLFKTYPQADANSDCVLTRSEMDAFRTPPTQRDVAYGYHERQTLDLYTLKTDRPTPLVIFIHGGGFTGGDKDVIWPEIVQRCQAAGLSVASINYRLSTDQPFPTSFVDSARAVQFLRYYARHYNLDPTRFAVTGNSAGGGISLWLAMHDDMARPDSADPIARQSTRVACASVVNAQVSYDYRFYREHGLDMAMQDRRFWKMYGLEKPEQFDDPRHYSVAVQTAAITHLSAGDPPMYLSYEISDAMPPTSVSQAVHHPLHARLLRERAEPLGVPVLIHAGVEHQKIDYLEFLARVLNGQPLS